MCSNFIFILSSKCEAFLHDGWQHGGFGQHHDHGRVQLLRRSRVRSRRHQQTRENRRTRQNDNRYL
jgi:hypothetical protein